MICEYEPELAGIRELVWPLLLLLLRPVGVVIAVELHELRVKFRRWGGGRRRR